MNLSENLVKGILFGSVDLYEVWAGRAPEATDDDMAAIDQRYIEIASEYRLAPDDSFERILDILYEEIEGDFSNCESKD